MATGIEILTQLSHDENAMAIAFLLRRSRRQNAHSALSSELLQSLCQSSANPMTAELADAVLLLVGGPIVGYNAAATTLIIGRELCDAGAVEPRAILKPLDCCS